ncbi:hypothetical protein D1872_51710 [compost metagenome]
MMPPDTTYNQQKQKEAMEARKAEIVASVANTENTIRRDWNKPVPITTAMDLVEKVIQGCGGEPKVQFLDVGRNYLIVQTRVPLAANIFQFMPEGEENPRFHKVVTKVLLQSTQVSAVKWVPVDNGAKLLVSISEN